MLVVGIHAIESFLESRATEIKQITVERQKVNNPRIQKIIDKARKKSINIVYGNDSKSESSISALVDLAWNNTNWWEWLQAQNIRKIALLDGVQDPHNLGACMRTACALGVEALLIPARRAAPLNTTAIKVASGAGAWLPVFTISNSSACLKTLKSMGFWLVAFSEHAEVVATKVPQEKLAIIVGNEAKGVRQSVMQQADYLFRLPTTGPVQSLNVSVALGIALTLVI